MSVAPIDHQISDLVFYLREFKGDSAKENLRNIIHNNSIGFHLLFSDFEVLGEHSRNDEHDALEIFSEFISICNDEEMEFVNINNIPKFANFEAKKYNVPFFVSSGNSKRNLESWRGNYLQEKAFIHLTHLHDKATKLYGRSEEKAIHILECYRKLSTSDHFYYLADIPGKDGIIHEMFSPYNSRQDAFESYKFAVDFVSNEIDKFLANDQ
jgi:alpha-amylase